MKKIIAVFAMSLMLGCAASTKNFFGAKMISKPVPRGDAACAMVEGWNINQVTGKSVNCVCNMELINESTRQALQLMGFAPVEGFLVTSENMCDSNFKPGE